MQIEDEHPSTLSITELLSEEKNKTKVVRILHQALTSMGFKESALELQKESNMFSQEETEFKVKTLLANREYQKINQVITQMEISPQKIEEVQQIVKELVVLKLIQEKQFEEAIEKIMSSWPSEDQKQLNFLSIIATDQSINESYFESREVEVLKHCTSDSFELKSSIEKMLKVYLRVPQIEQKINTKDQPFKKVVAESEILPRMGKTTFVKLNPKGNLICLIKETKTEMEASIWMINQTKITMGLSWKQESFGTVSNVCWDYKGQKIAICSQTKLGIFNAVDFKPKIIVDNRNLTNARLLCCKWDYNNLLFIGGLSDVIGAIDIEGKIVRTIRPFPKTREMAFNTQNLLYSICATKGLVTKYSIVQQKTLASFESPHPFMDIYLNESAQTVVVTNKENIYLLNALTLTLTTTLISPNNEQMYKIEAFFVKDWLIIYNEKLTGILQNKQVTKHHQWADCDAVDVKANKMITVKSTIMVWQSEDDMKKKNGLEMKEEDQEGEWHSLNLQEEAVQHLQDMESFSNDSSESESNEDASEELSQQEDSNPINIEYIQNEQNESNQQS